MLARYLRQQRAPVRYAVPHTAETQGPVSYGMQLLTRLSGLLRKHFEAVNPAQSSAYEFGPDRGSMAGLHAYLNPHQQEAMTNLIHDLHQTGQPGLMLPIMDLLHGDADVPQPEFQRSGGGSPVAFPRSPLDAFTALLHHLDREQHKAAQYPHSALRQYTPQFLEQAGHDLLGPLPMAGSRLRHLADLLHPDLSERHLTALPYLFDSLPAGGGTRTALWDLMQQLHDHALNATRQGRQGQERRAAVMGA